MSIPLMRRSRVVSGLLFIAVGGLAAFGAAGYSVGTIARMGPGFFPLVLGVLLSGVGVALLLGGMRGNAVDERAVQWDEVWLGMRPMLFSAAGLVQFAFTINIIGLPLSTGILVIIVSFSERKFTPTERLITAIALAGGVYVVFGLMLNLPIRMWI